MHDDDLDRRFDDAELLGFNVEEAEALAGGIAPREYQKRFDSMLPHGRDDCCEECGGADGDCDCEDFDDDDGDDDCEDDADGDE